MDKIESGIKSQIKLLKSLLVFYQLCKEKHNSQIKFPSYLPLLNISYDINGFLYLTNYSVKLKNGDTLCIRYSEETGLFIVWNLEEITILDCRFCFTDEFHYWHSRLSD
jgi:hypothetical protein